MNGCSATITISCLGFFDRSELTGQARLGMSVQQAETCKHHLWLIIGFGFSLFTSLIFNLNSEWVPVHHKPTWHTSSIHPAYYPCHLHMAGIALLASDDWIIHWGIMIQNVEWQIFLKVNGVPPLSAKHIPMIHNLGLAFVCIHAQICLVWGFQMRSNGKRLKAGIGKWREWPNRSTQRIEIKPNQEGKNNVMKTTSG